MAFDFIFPMARDEPKLLFEASHNAALIQ